MRHLKKTAHDTESRVFSFGNVLPVTCLQRSQTTIVPNTKMTFTCMVDSHGK